MAASGVWTIFWNICGMLVNGTGGCAEYFSDFYQKGKNHNRNFSTYHSDGFWEKSGSTFIFLYALVGGEVDE